MNTSKVEKNSFQEILKLISTIFSWTLFSLLIICAALLLYYFIFTKLYSLFGDKFEPEFSLYSIMSPSMTPNIQVYDVIVNVKVDDPKDIQIGDVITFISSSNETRGMTITHRVVSVIKNKDGSYSYQTKGDANPLEDSGQVAYDAIIGKVALKIPGLGKIQVFMGSATGIILVVLCVALFIILKGLVKRLKLFDKVNVQGKIGTILHRPLYLPYFGNKEIKDYNPKIKKNPVAEIDENTNPLPKLKEEEKKVEIKITSDDDMDIDLPDLK